MKMPVILVKDRGIGGTGTWSSYTRRFCAKKAGANSRHRPLGMSRSLAVQLPVQGSLNARYESVGLGYQGQAAFAGRRVRRDKQASPQNHRQGRVDLMLTRALGAPAHWREHLVIELKRPTVTGGEEIVAQVKKSARALAADPRWTDTKTTWTFWAVTYELDSFG
jgi:hypothetical protein